MAKILMIQEHAWQNLGIMYVSAALKQRDHFVSLVCGSELPDIMRKVNEFQPDAVGFSIMTGGHHWGLRVARAIKDKQDVVSVFGGPHVTYFPEFIENDEVDVIIRGEGEAACCELMDKIEAGDDYSGIDNTWVKLNGEIIKNSIAPFADIDTIAFPDRSIYDEFCGEVDMSVLNALTSRGCPYRCSFCYEEQLRQLYKGKGKHVRLRDIDSVIKELREVNSDGIPFDSVFFVDDYFGCNVKWLYPFLEMYKTEIGKPFTCLIRPEIVCRNEDYARRLKEAGCQSVAFGIETGNEQLRCEVLKKDMKDETIIKAAELLHAAGVPFKTYNLFGFPDETIEDSFATVELNIRMKTDYPWSNLFIPFPETELTIYAIDKGYLDPEDIDNIGDDVLVHSYLKSEHRVFFERVHKLFQTSVLCPFLWPLIKRICLLKTESRILDKLLSLWFGLVYFYVYWRNSRRNIFRLIGYAFKQLRTVLN